MLRCLDGTSDASIMINAKLLKSASLVRGVSKSFEHRAAISRARSGGAVCPTPGMKWERVNCVLQ